jgi:hypothetical protein
MQRLLVVILALTALFAVVAVGDARRKKVKHVATTTTISFSGTADPYGEFTNGSFSGKITSSAKCTPGRTVTVYRVGGTIVGTTTANSTGNWTVGSNAPVTAGQYKATVAKKVYKKRKKHNVRKTICEQSGHPARFTEKAVPGPDHRSGRPG